MCGIFGFTLNIDERESALKKMGEAMIHRGPDGEGYYLNQDIAMGMRRLSIIDLERGDQPFYSHDQSIVAFCNGEIYNYKELRSDLIDKGYSFQTNSDIEVLPHLFEEYGIAFVNKLNGMFAISIFDSNTKKLYLIRDHLGIKPLYYAALDDGIIYSSEIKPMLKLNRLSLDVNYEALSTYLDLRYIPKPMTPFKEVSKLDSGSYMIVDANENSIHKYWDPALPGKQADNSKASSEIEELMKESIEMQLVSDVPVGSFLSGGVDSSYVTAVAAGVTDEKFTSFHMRWKEIEGKIDESKYASKVADQYNINKVFKDVNDLDLLELIPRLIYYLEEPFADAAFIPTYFLADLASKEVKVILSGAGGDELFGGYPRHRTYPKFRSFVAKILYDVNNAESYFDRWKRGSSRYWKKTFSWYKKDHFKTQFERKFLQNRGLDEVNAVMLNDIEYYLQDNILFLTDKMTMAASLECRVPLLDYRVVEKAQKIPSSQKIVNGEKKFLLKKIAEKYVPKDVLYRKKEGFGFPIEKWINELKDLYFDPLMENGYMIRHNLITHRVLNKFVLKPSLDKKDSWFYWQIIVLEIWFQLFIEGIDYRNVFELSSKK